MTSHATTTASTPAQDADFIPLIGIDHIELYVGNALQAAYYYYRNALGFKEIAFRGLESGERQQASHVMQLGRVRLVLTGALHSQSPIAAHQHRHGDGVKVIALAVPSVEDAWREATSGGAVGVHEPHELSDKDGRSSSPTCGASSMTRRTPTRGTRTRPRRAILSWARRREHQPRSEPAVGRCIRARARVGGTSALARERTRWRGRTVPVPAARAGALAQLIERDSSDQIELGFVITDDRATQIPASIVNGEVRVGSIELRGSLEQIQHWRERAPAAWLFVEGGPLEAVAEIRTHDPQVGVKLRWGGTSPAAFPGVAAVASFVEACVRLDAPYKATTGTGRAGGRSNGPTSSSVMCPG